MAAHCKYCSIEIDKPVGFGYCSRKCQKEDLGEEGASKQNKVIGCLAVPLILGFVIFGLISKDEEEADQGGATTTENIQDTSEAPPQQFGSVEPTSELPTVEESDLGADLRLSYPEADTHLNEAYSVLKSQLSPQSQRALVDAQKAWIAFRDAEATLEGKLAIQAGHSQDDASEFSKVALTQERTNSLRRMINQYR